MTTFVFPYVVDPDLQMANPKCKKYEPILAPFQGFEPLVAS
jgi:hypothetical protein